jgi:GNAT superfamily N-acetyltransferase
MAALLRPATEADISAVRALMQELAQYEKLAHMFVATEDDLRDALFGKHPAVECLVAQWIGTSNPDDASRALSTAPVVAYALFFHNYSTFLGRRGLYLEDMYVQPGQRGRGIGKLMLQKLAALAVERGCRRFEWTVLDWNQPAIDFYESVGATVLPNWRVVRMTGEALQRLAGAQGDARG